MWNYRSVSVERRLSELTMSYARGNTVSKDNGENSRELCQRREEDGGRNYVGQKVQGDGKRVGGLCGTGLCMWVENKRIDMRRSYK